MIEGFKYNEDSRNLKSVSLYGFGLTLILLALGGKSPWLCLHAVARNSQIIICNEILQINLTNCLIKVKKCYINIT